MRAVAPARAASGRGSHELVLDQAFGVIFAVFTGTILAQFAAGLALSPPPAAPLVVLLCVAAYCTAAGVWAATKRFDRPLALTTLLISLVGLTAVRALVGSHDHDIAVYLLANLGSVAAAALLPRRLLVLSVALVLVATGVWDVSTATALEQAMTTLATVFLVLVTTSVLRSSARRADTALAAVHRDLAAAHAEVEGLRARRDAARRVHDDVLSVVKLLSFARPWTVEELRRFGQQMRDALAPSGSAHGRERTAGLVDDLQQLTAGSGLAVSTSTHLDAAVVVPARVRQALLAAAAEALRNVELHAAARSVGLTATEEAGVLTVTITDDGVGFDRHAVGPDRRGLRDSIEGRLAGVGGCARVESAPGEGTRIVLSWRTTEPQPQAQPRTQALARGPADRVDAGSAPRLWLLGLGFTGGQVVAGFFTAPLLSFSVIFLLHLDDVRIVPAAVSFVGLIALALALAPTAASLTVSRRRLSVSLVAVLGLAVLGVVAVDPGTTDGFAYWVAGLSAIPLAALTATVPPIGAVLCALADIAALAVGLALSDTGLTAGAAVGVLGAPPVAVALSAGLRLGLQRHERELELSQAEELRAVEAIAAAEAVAAADEASVAGARTLCAPLLGMLEERTAGPPSAAAPDGDDLRRLARTTLTLLRLDLTAPRLTAGLLPRLRDVVDAGTEVALVDSRRRDGPLSATARALLAASLPPAEAPTRLLQRIAVWLDDVAETDGPGGQESLLMRVDADEQLLQSVCSAARDHGLRAQVDGASVTVSSTTPADPQPDSAVHGAT